MKNCPRWLDVFIKLARPGAMVAMFALLVGGGLLFALVEFIFPERGMEAMKAFVGFFAAINDEYYETLRFMFGAYVLGRSGEAIATQITEQKRVTVQQGDTPSG